MNVLDAKVIHTHQGLETYLDSGENVVIKKIQIPTQNHPFYEIQLGIEYFLLRKEKYYDRQRNYFIIQMNPDFTSIVLKETETESLFSVKSEDERKATKALIGEWFIQSNSYKQSIQESIERLRKEEISTEEDINQKLKTINFLKKVSYLTLSDIQNAPIKKQTQMHIAMTF
ncbi:hypothetical protein [Priestia aryabhattai]|uniref:hypothetical protein n=1 Tax=Priestia aryabhattai TaxID=412384 RepID=UPI000890B9A8|nr:hypothetical protein SAMN04487777_11296 [Priestia aryabhattai B8W22]